MISIVVPVYNVEKYLDKCMQSLLNQTYKDMEILLIDDGSTDSSGEKCDGYAELHDCVTAYHKENGGLSDARNYGMERAKGEYIAFIDSDDYVEEDMMEFLISTIGDADMATCGIYNDYATGSLESVCKDETISFETDNEEAYSIMLEGDVIEPSVCSKIYKTSVAAKHRFPLNRFYEDAFYNNKLMPDVKRVRINSRRLYHYIHREGSITTSLFQEKDMDLILAYEETQELVPVMPGIKDAARLRLLWVYFAVLDKILMQDNYKEVPQYRQVLSFVRSNVSEIVNNKNFSGNRRIAAVILKFSVPLYRRMVQKKFEKRKQLFG